MPTDINELDVTDAGLKGIFGNRFEDETVKADMHTGHTASPKPLKIHCEANSKPMDASYEPVKYERSFNQKLMDTAKWSGLFSGLSLLFFYWQQTGQMQPSAAVPAMCACTAMVGWSIGKNARGR